MTLILIFTLSFTLNVFWELWHSRFYIHYKNRPITKTLLIRCAFIDALFITAVAILFIYIEVLNNNLWLIIPIGFTASIFLELFALSSKRWEYKNSMIIIPFIKTGLTPTIQIGLIGFITYFLVLH